MLKKINSLQVFLGSAIEFSRATDYLLVGRKIDCLLPYNILGNNMYDQFSENGIVQFTDLLSHPEDEIIPPLTHSSLQDISSIERLDSDDKKRIMKIADDILYGADTLETVYPNLYNFLMQYKFKHLVTKNLFLDNSYPADLSLNVRKDYKDDNYNYDFTPGFVRTSDMSQEELFKLVYKYVAIGKNNKEMLSLMNELLYNPSIIKDKRSHQK